jgi:hypothetical protein
MEMKNRYKAGLLAAGLLAGSCAFGQTYWTGAADGTNFNNAANWNNGLPTSTINGADGFITNSGANITMTANFNAGQHIRVGYGMGVPYGMSSPATLNVGTNQLRAGNNRDVRVGEVGGRGVVNQTGGSVYGNRIYLGWGETHSRGSEGVYNFSGGTLTAVQRVYIGGYGSDKGVMNLSGNGTVSFGELYMTTNTDAEGELNIFGGSLDITVARVYCPSTRRIPSIGAEIDSTGISTINVTGDFQFGSEMAFNLALGDDYTHSLGKVYTIIDAATFSGTSRFANIADGQTLNVDGNEFTAKYDLTDATFTLTSIPEPTTLGLIGIIGTGLMAIRRLFLV